MKQLNLNTIQKLIDDKVVIFQFHPILPLKIYKYSHSCTYIRNWNEYTLQLRGMVLDDKGNIVSRPFSKFFNNRDEDFDEIGNRIPKNFPYEIFEKLDGSLIQIFNYQGQRIITSSGSFTSEMVYKTEEMLNSKYPKVKFENGFTYLFEIIYPENKIVVDYGNTEKLILLAINEINTDMELSYDLFIKPFAILNGLDIVKKVADKKLPDLFFEQKHLEFENKEGYIVKFANGYRVKIKFNSYMKIQKTIMRLSDKYLYELLCEGKRLDDILDLVPDELYEHLREVEMNLLKKYKEIESKALEIILLLPLENRKECATFIFSKYKEFSSILFSMIDKNEEKVKKEIWKRVINETKNPIIFQTINRRF